jgi:hypothetical protein
MSKRKTRPERSIADWHRRLAIAGTAVGVLIITLAGAWAEARWPNAAGTYISITPLSSTHAVETLWQLQRVDGVRDAFAVFRGELTQDEIEGTGWLNVWFYANQTDVPALAFLPPDPVLGLLRGHLPDVHSPDEAVLSYELAQALRLGVGDALTIREHHFRVAGIWGPSTRLTGDFVQISAAAADAILLSSSEGPHHYVALPATDRDAAEVANRIWHTILDVEVLAPDWEVARAGHERAVLIVTLGGAVVLALLLSLPLLANLPLQRGTSTVVVALLSGIGGLGAGWIATLVANLYARHTLGLTPLQVTPRLAVAVLAGVAGMGLLAARLGGRWPWPVRYIATALVLALCAAVLVTLGALNESLSLALSEAQRTAADWVALPGVQADGALLRDLGRVPGIHGYVIEARGGLANEDEDRWVGPWPSSGLFYGMQFVGGGGTLSLPYRLGYYSGGPVDPDKPNGAVVGYDLAQEQGLEIGDTITIRDAAFTVVGIRERLRHDPDNDANYRIDVSLEALRRVLHDPFASGEMTLLIPTARSQQEKMVYLQEMGTRLNVGRVWTIEDRLAEITRGYPATWSLKPANTQGIVRHATAVYATILVLCSVLLLAVSALAVGGATMDRLARDTRRVALLRALGSNEGMLLGDYLQVASILGVAGALPGVFGGWALSTVLNRVGPSRSAELLFTPRLGASVFFFIVLAAMVAAVAPVSRAVRQDATWTLYSASLTQSEAASLSPATGKVTHGGAEP